MIDTRDRTESASRHTREIVTATVGRSGGVEGNARLTAAIAVVLLLLLATEGVTILFLRPLLSVHVFVGMLLIPPVALKLGSTGWRFVRYYAGSGTYRLKGPPALLLRLVIAPGVVASTILLFGSGVALLLLGPGGGIVLGLHKASFVLWFGTMSLHVLAHISKLPGLAVADLRPATRLPSARFRVGIVLTAVVGGVVLAAGTFHLGHAWLDWVNVRRFDQ